jgi:trigger factor
MTPETIEKEFDKMLDYLKWDLIKKQIAEKNSLKIEENDILESAKQVAKIQFAQYGMNNMPNEMVENYAQEMLKKEEAKGDFYERALENKVIALIKEQVTISSKKVSLEEFNKFFQ